MPMTPNAIEGMLVRFPQALVIAEYFNYDRFGEIVLALPLAGETRPFTGTAIDEPGAPANARTLANSLQPHHPGRCAERPKPGRLCATRTELPFSLNNRFRGGDTVQNAVGVLGYRLQPVSHRPDRTGRLHRGEPAPGCA